MISKSSQHRYAVFSSLFKAGTVAAVVMMLPISGVTFTLSKLLVFAITATIGTGWLLLREDLSALSVLGSRWAGRYLLAFLLTLLFSFSWTTMPVMSFFGAPPRFEGLLSYVVAIAYCLCALCLSQHPRGLRNLLHAITISNAVVVLYGLLQVIKLDPLGFLWADAAFLGRTFSTLGQPNALGSFIVLTLPFVAVQAIKKQGAQRWLLWSLVFGNLIVLLSTASRGALLGFGVAFMALCVSMWPLLKRWLGSLQSTDYGTGLVLLLLLCWMGYASFGGRFEHAAELSRSWGSRQVIWFDSVNMITLRPQGYGLETMGIAYPHFMSPHVHATEPLTASVDRAHNKPLDLLITLGPFGLLTYYVFLLALLLLAWQCRYQRGVLFAGGLGLLGYSVTLMFSFDTTVTMMFFWLIAGMMLGTAWQCLEPDWQNKPNPRLGRLSMLMLCILCVISTVVSAQWLRARKHMEYAELFFQSGHLSAAVQKYADAAAVFAFDRTLLIRLAESALVTIEHSDNPETHGIMHQLTQQTLDNVEGLTGGLDGTVPLLRAWQAALRGDIVALREQVALAKVRMPNTVDTYRIARHGFMLVGDTAAAAAAERDLIQLLPPYWKDRDSERGRILWKENPWLEEIVTNRMVREHTEWE